MSEKKDVTQAAADVRKLLADAFPGVKFYVKSHRYAGGSSVDVSWLDGPTTSEVKPVIENCKGWDNGYYNDYVMTSRSVSLDVMTAAAEAAAAYYGIDVPGIQGTRHPYLDDMTPVLAPEALRSRDGTEPLRDVVHRAAHNVSAYQVDIDEAMAAVFPVAGVDPVDPGPEPVKVESSKVYIFGNEATAEAFRMTAYYFGYDGMTRIGSALVMEVEAYETVLAKTYATPAAIVATQEVE